MNPMWCSGPNKYQGPGSAVCRARAHDSDEAVTQMTTERELWLAENPSSARAGICSCGQDLDCSHREHCPRCGIRIAPEAPHAA